MRAVVQRVSSASVLVDGKTVGSIGPGLAVLVGVGEGDSEAEAAAIATKLAGLRVFSDDEGKMNLSVGDIGGEMLVVSQFTLIANVRKGRRPSFVAAAPPDVAEPLVERVAALIATEGIEVSTGSFGAAMEVHLVNDGPVTIVLDAADGAIL